MTLNTSGEANTIRYAMYNNTTGGYNALFGANALQANESGYDNTAVGNAALYNNTTGGGNTAIGSNAMGSAGTAITIPLSDTMLAIQLKVIKMSSLVTKPVEMKQVQINSTLVMTLALIFCMAIFPLVIYLLVKLKERFLF